MHVVSMELVLELVFAMAMHPSLHRCVRSKCTRKNLVRMRQKYLLGTKSGRAVPLDAQSYCAIQTIKL